MSKAVLNNPEVFNNVTNSTGPKNKCCKINKIETKKEVEIGTH